MTPEAQRIAIAKVCGWTDIGQCTCKTIPRGKFKQDGIIQDRHLPDYLNDLNACHEMEKVLTDGQWQIYTGLLSRRSLDPFTAERNMAHAKAEQRAEMFLKTIGKWDAKAAASVGANQP